MPHRPFTRGLHELGNGCHAWLQPDGSWGYSNAGLVSDQGETLLVDTLFDLAHTREMLAGFRSAVPAAARIGTLVNTHSNGDHTFGNQLVAGARMLASRACAEEMAARRPETRARMQQRWREYGEAGLAVHELYGGRFDWTGVVYTPPTETFEDELVVHVGARAVHLVEVGPAHTRGDVLVHLPAERVVFTGDILFVDAHPAIWAGPVANWIAACDRIIGWGVETVVPGHGPVTDLEGVRRMRDYLAYIRDEARARYDAGLSDVEAARDIPLPGYEHWLDRERMVVNVNALYREFSGGLAGTATADELHARMRRWRGERAAGTGAGAQESA